MQIFSHIQTLWSPGFTGIGQVSLIGVADGPSGAELTIYDPVSRTLTRLPYDGTPFAPGDAIVTALPGPGSLTDLSFGGAVRTLETAILDGLIAAPGAATAYLDAVPTFPNRVTLLVTDPGPDGVLHVAREGGAGISSFRIGGSGGLTPIATLDDDDATYLGGVSSLAGIEAGGTRWVIAAAQGENGLTVLEETAAGALVARSAFGADDLLPVAGPAVVQTLTVDGAAIVLVASQGSSSLTALRLQPDGGLEFADQVNDALGTRFAGAAALAVFQANGQSLVAVAGSDGGVSLFQVLADGRLVLRDTIIDTVAAGLFGIAQLVVVQTPAGPELVALSTGENAVARIGIDPAALGVGRQAVSGGTGRDVIMADDGGGALAGGAGDDILIDGAGADWFQGDAGADRFVFAPDGETDTIADFDPTEDRFDLSAYAGVFTMSDITVDPIAGGARVIVAGDELLILSASGGSLDAQALAPAFLSDGTHVVMSDPPPQVGTGGNDSFIANGGGETIDGGAGIDTVSFAAIGAPVTVDLSDTSANGGAAAGMVLVSVENLIGTPFGDGLTGDGGGNGLTGGGGDDILSGGGGSDWLTPGAGADTVDGGAGSDMVSFVDAAAPVVVSLAAGTAVSGGETDTLIGIENVTGSIFGDNITGDDGDNRIRGLGNFDWMVGSAGNDRYEGGDGRDMISYVNAPDRVGVDLGAGVGLFGQAAGDTYDSVERATGSIYPDLFYGSDDVAEDFRGLGGYDWFYGSGGGRDRYYGGSGLDTVSYLLGSEGVTASLATGTGSRGDAAQDLYFDIERLTGTSFDDILTGNDDRNVLRGMFGEDQLFGLGGVDRLEGGASDDWLDGGDGFDFALYAGRRADYVVTDFGTHVTVTHIAGTGRDGTDTLVNIEELQFSDGSEFL